MRKGSGATVKSRAVKLTYAAALCVMGILIPMIFHAFGIAGKIFLPMHIPVLLAGLLLGPLIGATVGILVVTLSSALTGMPPLMPTGFAMCAELIAYGFVSGALYGLINKKRPGLALMPALIGAMLAGRAVWGVAAALLYPAFGITFSFEVFLTSALIAALPGIVIQIFLVPVLMAALSKANLTFAGRGIPIRK